MTVNISLGSNSITLRGNQIEGTTFIFSLTHMHTNEIETVFVNATVTGVVINFDLEVVEVETEIDNEVFLSKKGWYKYTITNSYDGKTVKEGLLYYKFGHEVENEYNKDENIKLSYEKE